MLALLLSKCAEEEAWLELESLRGPDAPLAVACWTESIAMRDSSSAGAMGCGELGS